MYQCFSRNKYLDKKKNCSNPVNPHALFPQEDESADIEVGQNIFFSYMNVGQRCADINTIRF